MRRYRPTALAVFALQRQGHDAEDRDGESSYSRGSGDGLARANSWKGRRRTIGAPAGDLHIITNVGQHKYFTRKGDNIYVTVPITVPEAALGAKIEVPTVEGKTQLRFRPERNPARSFVYEIAARRHFAIRAQRAISLSKCR